MAWLTVLAIGAVVPYVGSLPNHAVDMYRNVIDRELESHTKDTYLNLSVTR